MCSVVENASRAFRPLVNISHAPALPPARRRTACNAAHSIEPRTAKWLLAALDRTGDENLRRGFLRIRDAGRLRAMSGGCREGMRTRVDDVPRGVYPDGNEVAGHGMVLTNGPSFRR